MELFTDLKSRLPFRPSGAREEQKKGGLWDRLVASEAVLVTAIDQSGKIRSANRALCLLRDVTVENLVGTSLLYLLNAEDRSGFSERVREVFSTAECRTGQGRFLTTRERARIVHWILVPRVRGTGEVEEVHCLGVDLSASGSDGPTDSLAAELASLREKMAGLERDKVALLRQLEERAGASSETVAPVSPQESHEAPPIPGLQEGEQSPTLADLERRYILHVLDETKGRISGPKGAAAILGLHANTLRSRMAKHGIAKGM